ncbi:unnamed protein product [Chrysodeixis includens]|uniref:Peptidase M24 domain-containing protein n=1 Tax=Chrysodeixis includens TaxID=689277 RepID=A0A9N8PY62_CHRIL|nr:unnamed protein product [Chrysodeixis includens]
MNIPVPDLKKKMESFLILFISIKQQCHRYTYVWCHDVLTLNRTNEQMAGLPRSSPVIPRLPRSFGTVSRSKCLVRLLALWTRLFSVVVVARILVAMAAVKEVEDCKNALQNGDDEEDLDAGKKGKTKIPLRRRKEKKRRRQLYHANISLNEETEGGEPGLINATQKIDAEKIEDVAAEADEKKKKKKKNKSKSGKGPSKEQTNPPTIPIAELYPDGNFPEGQIMEHGPAEGIDERTAKERFSSEEKRALDRLHQDIYHEIRHAAEAHRQTRKYMRDWIKPGMTMIQICEELESTARRLIGEDGLKAGLAFPTGCSRNHCAAHYTPNTIPNNICDTTVLEYDDVVKIDFGTHINGRIDCAFTLSFNPRYDPLVKGVQEATEVYQGFWIHAGKQCLLKGGETTRMEENEFYAIETFSTGRGQTAIIKTAVELDQQELRHAGILQALAERAGASRYAMALKDLCDKGVVDAYPPPCDIRAATRRSSSTPSSSDLLAKKSYLAETTTSDSST